MKSIKKYTLIVFLISLILKTTSCTIILPPVTVTGTRTAAEKQIIGEQTELEKDVWMISSAKTTSQVDIKMDKKEKTSAREIQEENAQTYTGFAILETFAENFSELKKDGVIGENKNGLISNLFTEKDLEFSKEMQEKYKPDQKNKNYQTLIETIKQINQARNLILEGYIINQKRVYPDFNPDKKDLIKNQKNKYQNMAAKGDYIQQDTGEWIKKK